jgi:DNA-binding Xre family transcriptional regulator/integrase
VSLAVVRSLGTARSLRTPQELEDFEQELVDQYALAMAGGGVTDRHIEADRTAVFELIRFLGRPVWTATPEDGDRFLVWLRRERRLAKSTVQSKACTIARFFDFVISRYQGDIHALAGYVVVQPIDEFNRPAKADYGAARVPPAEDEVEQLFAAWRDALPEARKYLPAARDYLAASLWRRAGLRISETTMLDIRDWRPDLGAHGKLHVRFGKGSNGRGPKTRLVPAINSVDALLEWWLTDVRHQFGGDWDDPDAPLLPSERRDRDDGRACRVGPSRCALGSATPWTGGCRTGRASSRRMVCATSARRRCIGAASTSRPSRSCWATTGCRPRLVTSTSMTTTSRTRGPRPTTGSRPGCDQTRGELMRWNLRLKAAEVGIWKSTEMRRRLAEAGLEISAGKMSALWTGNPTSVRLDDLDVICAVLACGPEDLLLPEPDKVAARRPAKAAKAAGASRPKPKPGRHRSVPPA